MGKRHFGVSQPRPMAPRRADVSLRRAADPGYPALLKDLTGLLESSRRASVRAVNALMTATYWEIGHWIVEHEQGGAKRAAYGKALIQHLSSDLTARFGRGFGVDNLELFRSFYLAYPPAHIGQTPSGKSESPIRESKASPQVVQKSESLIRKFTLRDSAGRFPLPWTFYVHLLRRTHSTEARHFYEAEAIRAGWSVPQFDRQIASQFYERTALSRNKAAMLGRGAPAKPSDSLSADEEVRDPLVLEFLGLKKVRLGEVLHRQSRLAWRTEVSRSAPHRSARATPGAADTTTMA
jgi:hypothetical protein